MTGSTLFFMTYHVTGAGVEYDPKQQATAEFICDWLWENPPLTHKDDYLEKRN